MGGFSSLVAMGYENFGLKSDTMSRRHFGEGEHVGSGFGICSQEVMTCKCHEKHILWSLGARCVCIWAFWKTCSKGMLFYPLLGRRMSPCS